MVKKVKTRVENKLLKKLFFFFCLFVCFVLFFVQTWTLWISYEPGIIRKNNGPNLVNCLICFIYSICREANVDSEYSKGKKRLQSGWRKEYLTRHNQTELHKNAVTVPVQREAVDQVVYLKGSTKEGIIHLMRNVFFLCTGFVPFLGKK